ncbi:MAG: hypothetical protein RLZZ223_86 [Candidatus Parcubacteria bacterium]|jgi:dolichyl-phosphate beta-glucosyltransferase
MKISVVIPAYNEEKRISPTIHSVIRYLDQFSKDDYEVLVVLDGSQDNTFSVVANLADEYKYIRIINNKINRGKGAVVKQGILESKGEYVLFMDADNSTHIDELDNIMPHLLDGIQVVVGSRDLADSQVKVRQARYKELLGDLGNWWIQFLLVGGIKDTQCGFKVFHGNTARQIFDKVTMQGWSFDIEVLAIARYFGFKIKEMPVVWYNDTDSHVTLKDYLIVLRDTIIIRYRLWKGYYKIN